MRRDIYTKFHFLQFHGDGCTTWMKQALGIVEGPVQAIPHPHDPHYHVIAHRCGYFSKDKLLEYCQEHELAHAVVAEFIRDEPSIVMTKLIGRYPTATQWDILAEEVLAQTLQRFARANEEPIVADCDWLAMRTKFYTYIGE